MFTPAKTLNNLLIMYSTYWPLIRWPGRSPAYEAVQSQWRGRILLLGRGHLVSRTRPPCNWDEPNLVTGTRPNLVIRTRSCCYWDETALFLWRGRMWVLFTGRNRLFYWNEAVLFLGRGRFCHTDEAEPCYWEEAIFVTGCNWAERGGGGVSLD